MELNGWKCKEWNKKTEKKDENVGRHFLFERGEKIFKAPVLNFEPKKFRIFFGKTGKTGWSGCSSVSGNRRRLSFFPVWDFLCLVSSSEKQSVITAPPPPSDYRKRLWTNPAMLIFRKKSGLFSVKKTVRTIVTKHQLIDFQQLECKGLNYINL